MSDVFGLCLATVHGTAWIVSVLWKVLKETLCFNYRLVTAAGRFVFDLCSVSVSLLTSLTQVAANAAGLVLCWAAATFGLGWHWFCWVAQFCLQCCGLLAQLLFNILGVITHLFFCIFSAIWTSCIRVASVFPINSPQHTVKQAYQVVMNSIMHLSNSVKYSVEYFHAATDCAIAYVQNLTFVPGQQCVQLVTSSFDNFSYKVVELFSENHVFTIILLTILIIVIILLFVLCAHIIVFRHRQSTVVLVNTRNNYVNDFIEISDDEGNQADYVNNFNDDVMGGLNLDNDDDDYSESNLNSDDDDDSNEEDGDDVSTIDSIDSNDDDSDAEIIDIQLPPLSRHSSMVTSNGGIAGSSTDVTTDVGWQHPEQERHEHMLCVVCRDQVKSVLILPCRHLCLCIECAHTITGRDHSQRRCCPLCRTAIQTIMNVYT